MQVVGFERGQSLGLGSFADPLGARAAKAADSKRASRSSTTRAGRWALERVQPLALWSHW